jgi:hypothetical protein
MIQLDISENLKELVRDKKVVFVGPAPYLIDEGLGSLIDDYDIICRVNDIIPPSEIRKDYGSRTDVMFHNLGTPFQDGLKRKIESYPEDFKNLKMVACPVIKSDYSDTNYLEWPDTYVSNVVRNFEALNVHKTPLSWIGVKDYKKLYHKIGVEFNCGVGGIAMLLNCPLKELFITGFTFYIGGDSHDELYYEGHWDKEELHRTTVGIRGGHGAIANLRQIEFMKELMETHLKRGTLRIDSCLAGLFGFL